MALDLTKQVPRSPFDELEGYPWLARLIDKVRAGQVDQLGDYTPFPGGIDRRFLQIVGIAANDLQAVIESGATDVQIAAWVDTHCRAGTANRIAAFRQRLVQPPAPEHLAELQQEAAEIQAKRPELDLSHVVNFVHTLCLEEGHPFPPSRCGSV